ncbi:hypothetical protein D9M69_484560 [compost metagenome]
MRAGEAEQGPRIVDRHREEAPLGPGELQHHALLAHHVQLAADPAHAEEVQLLRVLGAFEQRLPALAAILGAQDQVEWTNHVAGLLVVEPEIVERLVRTVGDQPAHAVLERRQGIGITGEFRRRPIHIIVLE